MNDFRSSIDPEDTYLAELFIKGFIVIEKASLAMARLAGILLILGSVCFSCISNSLEVDLTYGTGGPSTIRKQLRRC